MRKRALIVATFCLVSCTLPKGAGPVVKTGVGVAAEVCKHEVRPEFAWVCSLSEAAVDALIHEILPGAMLKSDLSLADKQLLLQDLFLKIHQMRRDEPDMSMNEDVPLEIAAPGSTLL